MKWSIILIGCFVLLGFKCENCDLKSTLSISLCQTVSKSRNSSDKESIRFLDSIGKLNPHIWEKKVLDFPDSVFRSQKTLNLQLSKTDFDKLKKGCKDTLLDIDFIHQLFPKFQIDSTYYKDQILKGYLPITFYSFDRNKYDFKNFAIVLGYDNGFTRECIVYFFNRSVLIGEHNVYHRYGLELNHFTDNDGKTVIYYRQNFMSGSGIWWFNFNFYKYENNKLIPALNIVQNSNLQYPWCIRSYWMKTSIINTKPLTLKFNYYNEFPDTLKGEPIEIFNDSTEIKFKWENNLKQFIARYENSKLNRYKILTYYLNCDELLFINAFHDLLKSLILSDDTIKKQITMTYLRNVKSKFYKQKNINSAK
jgi:hypothetical protein